MFACDQTSSSHTRVFDHRSVLLYDVRACVSVSLFVLFVVVVLLLCLFSGVLIPFPALVSQQKAHGGDNVYVCAFESVFVHVHVVVVCVVVLVRVC